jgi:hypothetical protein
MIAMTDMRRVKPVDLQGVCEKKKMPTPVTIGEHLDRHVLDITTGI